MAAGSLPEGEERARFRDEVPPGIPVPELNERVSDWARHTGELAIITARIARILRGKESIFLPTDEKRSYEFADSVMCVFVHIWIVP
jgi:hypothetical protein